MAGFEFLILLFLIFLNGVLAMSELAVVSARTSRLQQRAANHVRGARAALELAENPNRFLSTVQIGITLIGIVTVPSVERRCPGRSHPSLGRFPA